ncbi:MAG TPA: (2Fe-2S)-binding protein [Anaerolineae bacterium]|nr:(2Fe-2S)-binding protein [Anaerolineae bacterium]
MSITLIVNGIEHTLDADPATPLLWMLRDTLGLTGTKYSCGMGLCGACTVHAEGEAVQSCRTPIGDLQGQRITTIEGLSPDGRHPLQIAWLEEQAPQCGYCQPGQIMAAAVFLAHTPHPTDAEIDAALSGILCRCGTYQRIRRAIHRVVDGGGR